MRDPFSQKGRRRGYFYGFNGKEKIEEQYGIEGTAYEFGARLYDSRLSKFLSVDPLFSHYSWNSPYSYAANNPVYYIDKSGENSFPFIVLRILAAMTSSVTYMQGGLDARSGIALTSAGGVVRWGVAADPHGNFAFYGTIGAFYDWFGNGETLSGAKSGYEEGYFYFGLDLSAIFNIGISSFSNVTDLSGLIKNAYGDIGGFEFAEQFDKRDIKGLDAGGGVGVPAGGIGIMTTQTYLFAFTLDDLIDISKKTLNFTAKYSYETAVNDKYKDVSFSIDYKVENRILTITGQITGKDSDGNSTVIVEYPIAKFNIKEYHLETENVKSTSK